MSRPYKKFIAVFALGVLLTGVGTGVMFSELSTLSYGGEYILGKPDMCTDYIDVPFEAAEEPLDVNIPRWNRWGVSNIKEDSSVPENTVRFCVTYNTKRVEPTAYWDKDEKKIDFFCVWKDGGSEAEFMMEAKDIILQNLKNRKIVSVDIMDIDKVTVSVNPRSKESLQLAY